MKDIQLDQVSHDIETTENDLVLIDELEAIKQNLKIRLWFFFSEWFLDTSLGLRYFEDILVKGPNLPKVESLIKATILQTENVNQLLSFGLTYSATGRMTNIEFMVDTAFGIVSIDKLNIGV